VGFHGGQADEEFARDRFVRAASGDHSRDFQLALTETGENRIRLGLCGLSDPHHDHLVSKVARGFEIDG
jgi:hypothetical protein